MAESRILDVAFCYKANIIPVGCRRARVKLLRDTTPAVVSFLSASEAPVQLQARLTFPSNTLASRQMTLRHDGSSYLRAVADMPGWAGGERRPFTSDDFVQMLRWERDPWAAEHGDRDTPNAILTTRSRELRGTSDHGYLPPERGLRPEELLTWDQIAPSVRKVERDGRDDARIAAIRSASEFVFIDGFLHRRVGPPIALSTRSGYPMLIHSDEYEEQSRVHGADANFWPIQYADMLLSAPRDPSVTRFEVEVSAPLENDAQLALSFVAKALIPQLKDVVGPAVEEMSAAGMEAFRVWRANVADAGYGDLDACLKVMEAVRSMAYDQTLFDGELTRKLRERSRPKLAHFDSVLARCAYALVSRGDAEQLASIV
jgi:hypothetical protein